MAIIAFNSFGGMLPRYGDQTIPDNAASVTKNALLLSNELRGLHTKTVASDLRSVSFPIRRVYRIPTSLQEFDWVAFPDETVDMVKGPLVNDQFDRYYVTSETALPKIAPGSRWVDFTNGVPDADPYTLGVPAPIEAPVFDGATGGTTDNVDRAYTYTYVTAYGEEGQPAPAVLGAGPDDAVWQISNIKDPTPSQILDRNIEKKFLYRTVTSNNGIAEYHFVAEIPLGVETYADTDPASVVSLNNILESESWAEPPEGLTGIIAHPNGFLVGFEGRDIYFSEPYRPHAWPRSYVLSTQDLIVGLGVYGSTVVVCTNGFPYTLNGIRPDALSFTKAETPDSCVSDRRAIVSMPFGVYYPSDNGLVLVSPRGFANATQNLLTIDEWRNEYNPNLLEAARWQSQYVAFYSSKEGFMFAPEERQAAFVELGLDVWDHDFIQEDNFSGDTYLVKDNIVYFWNPYYGLPEVYQWKSKEIITPRPVNFGAFKVEYDREFTVDQAVIDELIADNEIRFAYPLNPLAFHDINGVRKVETINGYVAPPPSRQDSQPQHKSPLYFVGNGTDMAAGNYEAFLVMRLFANNELVYEQRIEDEGMYRLPAGYKTKRWHVEFEGNVNLKSFKMAETGKELANI